jgi:Bacterial SH3 domain
MTCRDFACLGLLVAFATGNQIAAAQQIHCRVTDPTGTPLNVRAVPGGNVVTTLVNGTVVLVFNQTTYNGKAWAYIGTGTERLPAGWVFFDYLDCHSSK